MHEANVGNLYNSSIRLHNHHHHKPQCYETRLSCKASNALMPHI